MDINYTGNLLRATCLLVLMCLGTAASAQEGHPLSGTWLGDWGSSETDRNFLTMILQWDGKAISVLANPGPNSTDTGTITLQSGDWSVNIDMPMKDDTGTEMQFSGQGQLDKLGSQTRTLNGTWTANGQSGTFQLTRQSGA